jgi:hypothetical protein
MTDGVARAYHDLNGVDCITITGWRGRYEVQKQLPGMRGATILAPRRFADEYWTFAATDQGELRCHSSLIGSPSLLTESAAPLVVLLPADRIESISIRLEG